MEKEYQFWDHKFDFGEINNKNKKMIFQNLYKLNNRKISLLSMLLGIEIILTCFSKYILGLFLIEGFYAIEISFLGILFIYLASNIVYASIFNILMNFMRVVLMGSEPIGVFAMTISDISFLLIFAFLFFIIKKYWLFRKQRDQASKISLYIIIALISGLIALIISAFFSLLCNQLFIFDWYKEAFPSIMPEKNSYLWFSYLFIGLGITIAKFSICLTIFLSSLKIFILLTNKYAF